MKLQKVMACIFIIFLLNIANAAPVNTEQPQQSFDLQQQHELRKKLGIIVVIYLSAQGIIWSLWFLRLNRLVLKRYDRYDIPNFPKSKKDLPNVSND